MIGVFRWGNAPPPRPKKEGARSPSPCRGGYEKVLALNLVFPLARAGGYNANQVECRHHHPDRPVRAAVEQRRDRVRDRADAGVAICAVAGALCVCADGADRHCGVARAAVADAGQSAARGADRVPDRRGVYHVLSAGDGAWLAARDARDFAGDPAAADSGADRAGVSARPDRRIMLRTGGCGDDRVGRDCGAAVRRSGAGVCAAGAGRDHGGIDPAKARDAGAIRGFAAAISGGAGGGPGDHPVRAVSHGVDADIPGGGDVAGAGGFRWARRLRCTG